MSHAKLSTTRRRAYLDLTCKEERNSEDEFGVIIRQLNDLSDKLQETMSKEIEDLRIKQAEMQNTITEIKN